MRHFLLSIFFLILTSGYGEVAKSGSSHQPTSTPEKQCLSLPAPSSDSLSDSLQRILQRDSLLAVEAYRRNCYQPLSSDPSTSFFRAVPTSWYDVPTFKKHSIAPKTVLSGSNNRLLLKGNPSPITNYYPGTTLLSTSDEAPYQAHSQIFPNEFSSVTYTVDGSLKLNSFKPGFVAPETELFWENGVFDENILSLRFTRPITQNSLISLFTNYRFFKGTRFTHEPNDVYTFFSSISPDTSLLSHKGYNPAVNEFYSGIHIASGGKKPAFFTLNYGDMINQLPMDVQSLTEIPVHNRFRQFPLNMKTGWSSALSASGYVTVEGWAHLNRLRWNRSGVIGATTTPSAFAISTQDLAAAVRTGISNDNSDSLDGTIRTRYQNHQVPDSLERILSSIRPELRWTHTYSSSSNFSAKTTLQGGCDVTQKESDPLDYSPTWKAEGNVHFLGTDLTVYGSKDQLTLFPAPDSLESSDFYSFDCLRLGVEVSRSWAPFSLLLGYQLVPDPDQNILTRTWINGTPPFKQPESSLHLSLETSRLYGISLQSRAFLSDTRPYIKANGALSYLILPKLTHQAIELRLDGDYWSEREAIIFAGKDNWNLEIIDVNLTTTVHIKSFILFYKIDNLLNRKISYIPGWTLPGITFRWGFTWFIQR